MRVFLDTNVLVAAFATRGLCADVLRTVLAEHELLLSTTVLEELTRSLAQKLRVPESNVREIAAFLRAASSLAPAVANRPPVDVRDPDDAVILAEALAFGADVLVTGDKDLLEVRGALTIRIVDPRGFWNLVRDQGA